MSHPDVQRGLTPARSTRDLVDALRQDFAGAGDALSLVRLSLSREVVPIDELEAALDRLEAHLNRAERKATLAFGAATAERSVQDAVAEAERRERLAEEDIE